MDNNKLRMDNVPIAFDLKAKMEHDNKVALAMMNQRLGNALGTFRQIAVVEHEKSSEWFADLAERLFVAFEQFDAVAAKKLQRFRDGE